MESLELDNDITDTLNIALSCAALFDQYEDVEIATQANDDCYENLYPSIA